MKLLLRALALGVGPVLVAVGLGVAEQGKPVNQLALQTPISGSAASCMQPPVFKPGYQMGENYVLPNGEGFRFGGEAWIEAQVCSSGTLAITATGEMGGDEPPQLVISLNGEVLSSPSFTGERTIHVEVPSAGLIYLGYFNDYYLAALRTINVKDLNLESNGCEGFVKVAINKGGTWDAVTQTASLNKSEPIIFTPCGGGNFTFQILGRDGNDAFPIVTINQNGKALETIKTNSKWQKIEVEVEDSPIILRLINPYGKTLADRNLDVKRIEFIPATVSAR